MTYRRNIFPESAQIAAILILAATFSRPAFSQSAPAAKVTAAGDWTLAWSDEFNGSSIDPTNWTFDTGAGGWGNSELEYYTDRPANATVANGNLLIIAKKESYSGSNYTSARLKTQGLRSFKFGRIEARMKLQTGKGIWPAFWMLGNNFTSVNWPKCGELDIMEHINDSARCFGTMHWDNNGHVSAGGSTPIDANAWHAYSIEWDSTKIIFLLDSTFYFLKSIAGGVNNTQAFQNPFFIVLNCAVGGVWPGNPDGTTKFPDTTFVDYVRVYTPTTTGVKEGSSTLPDHSRLLPNYPNPFNPTTRISYTIGRVVAPSASEGRAGTGTAAGAAGSGLQVARSLNMVAPTTNHILLTIHDLLGRQVAVLVDGFQQPGSHEVVFDAGGLASGVYLCRLAALDNISVRPISLVR
jgi:beta-glucanase (GH16 family)